MAAVPGGLCPKSERDALTAYGEGYSDSVPAWSEWLDMAREWGVKPWEIPDAPVAWVERWKARNRAYNRRQEVEARKWQTKQ